MELVVDAIDFLTAEIVQVRFACTAPEQRRPYAPGAHLHIEVPTLRDGPTFRDYSLLGDGVDPSCYEIAVLRHERGLGSGWVHGLVVGDTVHASVRNAFELHDAPSGHVLIAGGIGITPILSMARRLTRDGKPFDLHYAGTCFERMAFHREIQEMGSHCRVYDREHGSLRDALPAILVQPVSGKSVYVCGPGSLIGAVISLARESGWPDDAVYYELFEGALAKAADAAFNVVLRQSGCTVRVDADQTILDALLAAGIEPLYDCKRGECGMCLTPVLEGAPDHRDHYLSPDERGRNDAVCVCVSRSITPVLVLDF